MGARRLLCGGEVNHTLTKEYSGHACRGCVTWWCVRNQEQFFVYILMLKLCSEWFRTEPSRSLCFEGLGFHDSLKLKCNPKGEEIGPNVTVNPSSVQRTHPSSLDRDGPPHGFTSISTSTPSVQFDGISSVDMYHC